MGTVFVSLREIVEAFRAGKIDQRIGIEQGIVIDEALQIVHEDGDFIRILGRSVNGAPGGVFEGGSG